ncbi:MAG TPA: hypothetical protein ENK44_03580 [Caldithrix abyssi]|uniref:Thioredoxin family protein n=1 Tax=Caldithrix abyssi TaxID=187145 RepID=A0A7V4TZZ7_CALAY|nr:hypothetical protein [Caldithrix abyssi]
MEIHLLKDYETALSYDEYEAILGEQKALHQLHYRKAVRRKPPFVLPPLKILIITVPPCGDSLAIIPALQKYLQDSAVEIRIALREDYPDLMNRFLTNGKQAVPVILVLDESGRFLFRFGPRPKPAQEIFEQMRPYIESGEITRLEVSKKIRHFYAKDRGQSILYEFETLLVNALSEKESLIHEPE